MCRNAKRPSNFPLALLSPWSTNNTCSLSYMTENVTCLGSMSEGPFAKLPYYPITLQKQVCDFLSPGGRVAHDLPLRISLGGSFTMKLGRKADV